MSVSRAPERAARFESGQRATLRGWFFRLIGGLTVCLLGCSLLVDASGIDEECPPDQKPCGTRCVSKMDPAYGCATDCQPCRAGTKNAIFECVEARCTVVACVEGYGCPESDCAFNIFTDPHNCGACGKDCHSPCSVGKCTVSECDAGYADCNERAEDGCETNLKASAAHCGACGVECADRCTDGKCE